MKTCFKVFLGLMISFFSTTLSAQQVDMMLYERDVNGVRIGTRLTRDRVVAEFGEPTRYEEQDSGDNGINRWYYYGDTYIHTKDHIFDEFAVCDASFAVFTLQIHGGLTIGDPLSKLDNFIYGKPEFVKTVDDTLRYRLFDGSDNPVHLYVKDGIIVDITYHDPI